MRFFGKRGELRIQSGPVSGGSHYFGVTYVQMDLSGPIQRPVPDEIPVLDRGQLLASTTHYIQGPDDVVMAPLNVTFTAHLDDTMNRNDFYDALGNPSHTSPWTVGGLSFAATNGRSQIFNGSGVLVSTPVPFLSTINRVDLAVLWRGGTPGTNDEGMIWRECYFPPQEIRITEAADAVAAAVTAWCYGSISHITAFSAMSAV